MPRVYIKGGVWKNTEVSQRASNALGVLFNVHFGGHYHDPVQLEAQ